MLKSGKFSDKKILLLDKDRKTKNDRTWCFWEEKEGFFEEIVYSKWDAISFLSDTFSAEMNIRPYQYKMIRGIDFYQYCFQEINKHANVEMQYGTLGDIKYEKDFLILSIDKIVYRLKNTGTNIFNSIYNPGVTGKKNIRLLQHFKGWRIETKTAYFDTATAVMMDFRVKQHHGTSFAYVLPFTTNTALVEYTLFTKQLLESNQYDEELKNYIDTFLRIKDYTITEEEFGVIPMTNEKFNFRGKEWNIGTAGGQTKASSGYTFQFIQKQSQQILACLLSGKSLQSLSPPATRFRFYDHTLLHILYYNKLPGKQIFSQLFQKNKPQQVLKFLDNESSFAEEVKIISTLPVWPFLKAAFRQL